jgi:hypothetical protein
VWAFAMLRDARAPIATGRITPPAAARETDTVIQPFESSETFRCDGHRAAMEFASTGAEGRETRGGSRTPLATATTSSRKSATHLAPVAPGAFIPASFFPLPQLTRDVAATLCVLHRKFRSVSHSSYPVDQHLFIESRRLRSATVVESVSSTSIRLRGLYVEAFFRATVAIN